MDVAAAVRAYISKIVDDVQGVKVLLLDAETVRAMANSVHPRTEAVSTPQTPIISMSSTTSALLSHEIYLTDRLDNVARERMSHIKCICFLRPTSESIKALEDELRNPRYSGYWLYFTHILQKSAIERLAEADEGELVREVQVRNCLRKITSSGS